MPFELHKLSYAYDALEPYIDSETMNIHYNKHHQSYVDKLNDAVKSVHLSGKTIEHLLAHISSHSTVVRNNAGGHYNHTLFWESLQGKGQQTPEGELAAEIAVQWGDFSAFKKIFTTVSSTLFGSGWVWFYVNHENELTICSTANHDNPLMDVVPEAHQGTPILVLDVWEHSYYLKYQNRRLDYINAFWKVVNWRSVEERYIRALSV